MSVPAKSPLYYSLKLKFVGVIVAVLLACFLVFSFYRAERAEHVERLFEENEDVLLFSEELVNTHLGGVIEDLLLISQSDSLREYIKDPTNAQMRSNFLQDLQNFSIHKKSYAQLRYLDANGMERVRVDSGGLAVMPEQLQNKSSRYYFTEGMRVESGSIYISPVDLNIENDVVQQPRVPMIRFVLPIDDAQRGRLGVIVLNFHARQLLERLRLMGNEANSNVELLNERGYWLLNPNPDMEWGFMFPEGAGLTMAQLHPQFWMQITREDAGMFYAADSALFWRKIPIHYTNAIKYKPGTEVATQYWTMALRYDGEAWRAIFQPIVSKYLILGMIPILVGIAAMLYLIMRDRYTQKLNALNQLNAKILENAQVAVISTDLQGQITSFNEFAQVLSGWSAEELIDRQSAVIFFEPFQLEERSEEIKESSNTAVKADFSVFSAASAETGRDVREWIFTRKDRSQIPVIVAVSVIRDNAEEVSGYLLVVVDISEQKRVESALLEAREHAETLVQMKSQFLANMSHEIRTPMNGVIGLANLLLTDDISMEQRKMVETLVRSADTLMVVINDILDFSKIEAGALALEETSFDLRESIDNTLTLFAADAEARGVELINQTAPMVDYALWGDSHRVTQILSNLVGNAVKFTSDGGEVCLSTHTSKAAEDVIMVHFVISDTGIGMNEATQKKIFQPFIQADSSTTRKFGGTGLGLAITTELIRMMNGKIRVESELDVGTQFYIDIPFSPDYKSISKYDQILERNSFIGKRALVVDDNLTNLLVIQGQLTNLGFKVKTFESANSAYLEYVNNSDYDLIVVDYLMPELDGLELARRLKRSREGKMTKLVMLSSSQVIIDPEDRRFARIDAYLTKPISQRELHFMLNDQLVRRALETSKKLNSAPEIKSRLRKRLGDRELRMVLVDDNETNRMVMGLQFRSIGLEVLTVESAEELLKIMEDTVFDVILMDCNMPDMDGYEATEVIRQREAEGLYAGRRSWIIAATAFAFEEDRDKCLKSGMDDYISKPARLPELAQALEQAIDAQL